MKANKKIAVSITTFLRGGRRIRDMARGTRQIHIATNKRVTQSLDKWNNWKL